MVVKNYFVDQLDVIGWRETVIPDTVKPWKPRPLDHASWPPDYRSVYAWRLKTLRELRDPEILASAKVYYAERSGEFIMHWMDTYDPRRTGNKWVPFVLFLKQDEFVRFLDECVRDQENGLVEKCRDAGMTWICCAWSIHSWLFVPDDAIGFGSRKKELVDKIGDPSSIFEKLRLIVRRLPKVWRPKGLTEKRHMTEMKLINPENNSVITGEIGDSIGRGGRTRVYFKDESAHYEHPETVEASLGDNTNVQIDISSVNGPGNVFHKRREAGIDWVADAPSIAPGYTRVFVMDRKDHPEKNDAWYNLRKQKAEREGLQHIFAQEVDRNYNAAVSNNIIKYEWIQAAVDAHKHIRWKDSRGVIHVGIPDAALRGRWYAGLDVADGGIDRNALGLRNGIVWRHIEEWGERDPGVTTRRALAQVRLLPGIITQYDSIGVGAAVKSEYNRLIDAKEITASALPFVGWNAGAAVINPFERIIPDDDDSLMNKDYFHNFKAQAWWSLRTRFYKTWNNITNGVIYEIDELISLDSTMPLLKQLMKELIQPTSVPAASTLRMVVDKKPDGMKSPNLADAGVMMYFPVPMSQGVSVGKYGF